MIVKAEDLLPGDVYELVFAPGAHSWLVVAIDPNVDKRYPADIVIHELIQFDPNPRDDVKEGDLQNYRVHRDAIFRVILRADSKLISRSS